MFFGDRDDIYDSSSGKIWKLLLLFHQNSDGCWPWKQILKSNHLNTFTAQTDCQTVKSSVIEKVCETNNARLESGSFNHVWVLNTI
jgi:hypothetical protein